jgi:hypothetical protein
VKAQAVLTPTKRFAEQLALQVVSWQVLLTLISRSRIQVALSLQQLLKASHWVLITSQSSADQLS